MFNIALEGKFLLGACVASIAASVAMLALGNAADRRARRDRGGHAGLGRASASCSPGWASGTGSTRSSLAS